LAERETSQRFLDLPSPPEIVRLPQDLKGVAYRFALLLPVLSRGREVFGKDDLLALQELLTDDFGGCTYTAGITHPLLEGTWRDHAESIVRDKHVQFVVYTTQTEETGAYFRELQQRLQAHGQQEKVLIEQTTVRLL
jgi:hypothetical protein